MVLADEHEQAEGGVTNSSKKKNIPCCIAGNDPFHDGWNVLTGSDDEKILGAIRAPRPTLSQRDLYPAGAGRKIREVISCGI